MSYWHEIILFTVNIYEYNYDNLRLIFTFSTLIKNIMKYSEVSNVFNVLINKFN